MQQQAYFSIFLIFIVNFIVNSIESIRLKKSIHIYDNLTIGSEIFDLNKYLHETQLLDDYGYNNVISNVQFNIEENNGVGRYFRINNHTGVISVNEKLDTIKELMCDQCNHMYCNLQLIIQVETGSTMMRYLLRVYIQTVSDYQIKFEKNIADFDVDEEIAPVVLHVGNTVNYTGCLKLKYDLEIVNILESKHDDWVVETDVSELKTSLDIKLVIEGTSMYIQINKPIDREIFEIIELKLSLSDSDKIDDVELILSIMRIRLKINDLNDNEPIFVRSNIKLNINEDTPRMTKLFEIKAIDKDTGLNGQVSYKLLNESKFFYLNSKTGFLFLVKNLDYEKPFDRKFADLIIQAQDSSVDESERKRSTCLLTITVVDVNDNKPTINIQPVAHSNALASSYVQDVTFNYDKNLKTENQYQFIYFTMMTPFDTVLANIRVKDIDAGFNGYIDYCVLFMNETAEEKSSEDILPVYLLDKMNDTEYFNEKLYELRTNMVFNSSKMNKTDKYLIYNIVIQVSDSGVIKQLKNEIYLQLIVVNTNYEGINLLAYSSYSSFYEFNYKISITENNQFPIQISSLNMDKVKSLTNNRMQFSMIKPSITSKGGVCNELLLPYIQINPNNGDIILKKRLDRELCVQYDFLLDYFRMNLTINLSIYVEDVNDNRPNFLEKEYRVLINKTNHGDAYVLKLNAEDDDLNSKVIYRLNEHNLTEILNLNEFNGELLIKDIDHYKDECLNVTVRAIDADNLDYFDETMVIIHFNKHLEVVSDERKAESINKSIFKTKSFKFIVVLISILIMLLFIVLIIIYYLINDTSTLNTENVVKRSAVNEITINRDFKLVIDRDMSDLFETSTFNRTAVNSENVSQDSKGGGNIEIKCNETTTNGIQQHQHSISMNTLAIPRNESAIYDQKNNNNNNKKAVFELFSESDT